MTTNLTTQQILNLVAILGKMKNLRRTGWVNRGVKNPESDADHSFSLAVLAMFLAPAELDKLKCLQMALIHDMPEIFCGDFMPDQISDVEKNKLETDAMHEIAHQLRLPQLSDLFAEFEAQKTPEAKFVKALDRLDNVLTAKYYQTEQKIDLVEEFAASARSRIENLDAETRELLQSVLKTLL